ncbi:hypothetical protein [Crocosphaera subtropica]|nr:hypothetical protein [Crocosphaera subtropica]
MQVLVNKKNYYAELSADYSQPGLVPQKKRANLIELAQYYISLQQGELPSITPQYTEKQIEEENKQWWPTHCEALRQGRGDLLSGEYRDELVYFCQDGPFYGKNAGTEREQHWWAIIAQPGVTMTWPIVMFKGDVVYFEWQCLDDITHETIAKGNVTFLRRGHQGGVYLKTEQLTFYRDVFASEDLLNLVNT